LTTNNDIPCIPRVHEALSPEKLKVVWRDECFIENDAPKDPKCKEGEEGCNNRGCTISEYLQYIARNMKKYDAGHILYAPVTVTSLPTFKIDAFL